jgi:putative ABC transport system ATP-binding protein
VATVRLRGVSRTFAGADGPVRALRGVDLDVGPGDRLRILGPSGSGKSTLVAVLGLLDAGYEGSCLFDGREVRDVAEPERAALRLRRVGFAFQDLHLVPSLTALENLELVARAVAGTPSGRPRELLEEAGLGARMHALPGVLSGGERRRLALARALVHRPALLLLDEPTAGLDAASAERAAAMVRRAADAGTAVVAVGHDPDFPGPGFTTRRLAAGALGPPEPPETLLRTPT